MNDSINASLMLRLMSAPVDFEIEREAQSAIPFTPGRKRFITGQRIELTIRSSDESIDLDVTIRGSSLDDLLAKADKHLTAAGF